MNTTPEHEPDTNRVDRLPEQAALVGIHDVGQFSERELADALRRREEGQDPDQASTHAEQDNAWTVVLSRKEWIVLCVAESAGTVALPGA